MGKDGRIAAKRKVGGGRILEVKEFAARAGIAVGIGATVSFLLYDSPLGMAAIPGAYALARAYRTGRARERRRARINLEFKDYMRAVSAALAAGGSVERSFLAGQKDISRLYGDGSMLAELLRGMEGRLGLKEPIERVLCDFAEESDSEDIENFVEIFCYAKRGGGDFIRIMESSVRRICDKMEVTEEIRSVMAEKELEQKVMCAAPVCILLFFKLSSPEFIGRLYGNPFGVIVMTAALALYGTAFFLGMKLTKIEV